MYYVALEKQERRGLREDITADFKEMRDCHVQDRLELFFPMLQGIRCWRGEVKGTSSHHC